MKVGIIGGGAAGLAAAAFCGGDTAIVERNEKVGKKLYITGKGRCNLTNNCALYEFFPNIVRGEKFMISSLTAFPPQALMEFMGENGLRLKTERGGRVFPASDKSSDVIKTLLRAAEDRGAKILLDTRVLGVAKDGGGFAVHTDKGDLRFDRLIVATGGLGYPSTGSTGDGYDIARSFGHSIVPAVPGLAPLLLKDDVSPLRGLSLRNVRATVTAGGKSVSEFGEMLFTDDGVSGPIILTLVSRTNRLPLAGAKLSVDLKPALSPDTLDDRLTSDLGEMRNKDIANILTMLMPKALIPYVLERSGVPPHVKGNSVTRAQRYAVGFCVKNLTFTIERADDVKKAIITSGGVDLKEVDPRTMESKLVPGLYFAGEVLDVDALTGGYNLQCAFATGRSAGIAAGSK